MSDDLATIAARDVAAFDAALAGSGVEAQREWSAVRATHNGLSATLAPILDQIAEVQSAPYMPAAERLDRLNTLRDIGDALIRSTEGNLKAQWPAVQQLLEAAAASDLKESEPADRLLIRDEIDRYVKATTDGQRKPVLAALMELARQNPARYGAELHGVYGQMKLTEAGDAGSYAALKQNIRLLTPGSTPKAQAARAAIPMAARAQAHTNHAVFQAREALAAAMERPKSALRIPGINSRY